MFNDFFTKIKNKIKSLQGFAIMTEDTRSSNNNDST